MEEATKTAYVSPELGALDITMIRDGNPRVTIALDLGIPNFTVFSMTFPLAEGAPREMSELIAEAVNILLDEVASFMIAQQYEEPVIVNMYQTVLSAFKGMSSEADTSKEQDVASTLASLGGDPDIQAAQHPMVQHAQAALDRAELNLSYTVVRAPESGIVTKVDQLQVGNWVQGVDTGAPPTALFSLVSTKRLWVTANFKETELTHMRPGQTATVEIDTYPDVVFQAKVQSLSPGTGLTFSLLPAENATGNWVKVVQRLPVRLSFDQLEPNHTLAAGLSATVEVDTEFHRPWLDHIHRMLAWLIGRPVQTAER